MRVGAFFNLVAKSETKLLNRRWYWLWLLNGEMEWIIRRNNAKRANLGICFAGPAGTSLLN